MEDRRVQQALRMVLDPIVAADVLPGAHGCRQGHRPQTALSEVARRSPRVSWVIAGDIGGCCDNLPPNGILKAVARRLADEKVLALVSALLTTGDMEHWKDHQTSSGTPPGGIVSPLLCHSFLHQLDESLESLGAHNVQTKQESTLRRSADYRKRDNALFRARRHLRGTLAGVYGGEEA